MKQIITKTESIANEYKLSRHEFNCILGTAYSEIIDMKILESKKKVDKDWFKRMESVIEYIIMNYFFIEVEDE